MRKIFRNVVVGLVVLGFAISLSGCLTDSPPVPNNEDRGESFVVWNRNHGISNCGFSDRDWDADNYDNSLGSDCTYQWTWELDMGYCDPHRWTPDSLWDYTHSGDVAGPHHPPCYQQLLWPFHFLQTDGDNWFGLPGAGFVPGHSLPSTFFVSRDSRQWYPWCDFFCYIYLYLCNFHDGVWCNLLPSFVGGLSASDVQGQEDAGAVPGQPPVTAESTDPTDQNNALAAFNALHDDANDSPPPADHTQDAATANSNLYQSVNGVNGQQITVQGQTVTVSPELSAWRKDHFPSLSCTTQLNAINAATDKIAKFVSYMSAGGNSRCVWEHTWQFNAGYCAPDKFPGTAANWATYSPKYCPNGTWPFVTTGTTLDATKLLRYSSWNTSTQFLDPSPDGEDWFNQQPDKLQQVAPDGARSFEVTWYWNVPNSAGSPQCVGYAPRYETFGGGATMSVTSWTYRYQGTDCATANPASTSGNIGVKYRIWKRALDGQTWYVCKDWSAVTNNAANTNYASLSASFPSCGAGAYYAEFSHNAKAADSNNVSTQRYATSYYGTATFPVWGG